MYFLLFQDNLILVLFPTHRHYSDRTLTGIITQINVSNAKSLIVDLISLLPDHYL